MAGGWSRVRSIVSRLLTLSAASCIVLLFLYLEDGEYLIFLGLAVAALSALELTWWHRRMHTRFIKWFGPSRSPSSDYRPREQATSTVPACRQPPIESSNGHYAISGLAKRWFWNQHYIPSLFLSFLAGGLVFICFIFSRGAFTPVKDSVVGWNVLISSATSGGFVAVLTSCYAPTVGDACSVFFCVVAFIVSAINSFVSHYENMDRNDELLDSFYVCNVAVFCVVCSRIISNKNVTDTLVLLTLDFTKLGMFFIPLTVVTDFLEDPYAVELQADIGALFLSTVGADFAYSLQQERNRSRLARQSSLIKSMVWKNEVAGVCESMVMSAIGSVVGILVSKAIYQVDGYNGEQFGVLITTGCLQPVYRKLLKLASVVGQVDRKKWSLASLGVVDVCSPFIVGAASAYYPYIQSLYHSEKGDYE